MPSFSPALHSQSTVVFSDTFKFLAIDDDNQLDDEEQSTLQVWTNLTGTWQEHAFVKHETEVGSILVADVPITSSGKLQIMLNDASIILNVIAIWLTITGDRFF